MPRFGTSPGSVDSRRRAGAAARTTALVVALLSIGPAGASASTAELSWGAHLPPRISAELVAPIIDDGRATTQRTDAPAARLAARGAEPAVCSGCTPPLVYHGGVVMGTPSQAGRVTITPIYWVMPDFTMSAGYRNVINRYLDDIDADSGQKTNVYSVNAEYYRAPTSAGGDQMAYDLFSGTPIVDTSQYPAQQCNAHVGFTHCITDAQIRTRIAALLVANGLPCGSRPPVPGLLPAGREHHRQRRRVLGRGVVRHPRLVSVDGPERTGHLRLGALPDRGLLRRSVPQRRRHRLGHVLRR